MNDNAFPFRPDAIHDEVPASVIEALGSGKRPAVVVTVNGGYTYRSTVGVMNEQFLVPLSAAHREAAGVSVAVVSSSANATSVLRTAGKLERYP
ncbi:DUF1905 domain-containing protein, partial [Bacillus sp. S34]|nr:DUF1905 domain-containing protein [Bacillus sp. S34]